eukprot:CAMPEP_0198229234 /NCGR_PEP_ID=MMETSP1445-20131203/114018_1 /TAXON_ID=36898 /ORGANISM="Pyramimonas sp., Strain CCMP2087" /LENGTH=276 /DNA_ID=CAMNT_0043909685 /DNA_START=199 /DNA_END=1029 /DNA_ORIENTATION=-
MRRDWAPYGADRFIDLVRRGYFTDVSLFRKNPWIVQFGAVQHPQKGVRAQFQGISTIADDPPTDCGGACTKGRLFDGALSFAGGGKNSRDSQLFFVHNMADQPIGHELWEVPIGNVTKGMGVIASMYGGYGEKVDQVQIFQHGNTYTRETFPLLDYVIRCSIKNQTASTASSSQSDPQATSSSNYKETAAILFVISAVIALNSQEPLRGAPQQGQYQQALIWSERNNKKRALTVQQNSLGEDVRAKRVESEIPMNPFTAGVYIAMMIAQVRPYSNC